MTFTHMEATLSNFHLLSTRSWAVKAILCALTGWLCISVERNPVRGAERTNVSPPRRYDFLREAILSFGTPTTRLKETTADLVRDASDASAPSETRMAFMLELFCRRFHDGVAVEGVSPKVLSDWAKVGSGPALSWIALTGVDGDSLLTEEAEEALLDVLRNREITAKLRAEAFGVVSILTDSESSLSRTLVEVLEAEDEPSLLSKEIASVTIMLFREGYGVAPDDVANSLLLTASHAKDPAERSNCLTVIRRFRNKCDLRGISLERQTLREIERRLPVEAVR